MVVKFIIYIVVINTRRAIQNTNFNKAQDIWLHRITWYNNPRFSLSFKRETICNCALLRQKVCLFLNRHNISLFLLKHCIFQKFQELVIVFCLNLSLKAMNLRYLTYLYENSIHNCHEWY